MNDQERRGARAEWLILAAAGAVSLLPYLANHHYFARMYWFGDEFDLIDQIDRIGFWKWVGLAFAENFVPLFKVLWGGAVICFHGSYAAMLALVWLTHAANVVLLGRLLRACGLGWAPVLLALAAFGLAPSNLETLAWSVQWSAMLAVTFMLAGLDLVLRGRGGTPGAVSNSAASALAFSRGVLTGPLIALAAVCSSGERIARRAAAAAWIMAPSVAVAILITVLVPSGNQDHMAGHWLDAAVYGTWYFALNPAHQLFGVESWGPRTAAALLLAKLLLMAWCLARSRGRVRLLFVLLLLFDLGNAALLGVGRFHTGLPTVISSRYQYASLIAVAPFAAFWADAVLGRLLRKDLLRSAFAAVLVALSAWSMLAQWPARIREFSDWRGVRSREIFMDGTSKSNDVPGFPGFPMARAKEIVRKYSLH
ncbi:MAG TPA: hypothetical protein VGG37_01950 [Opitutaceae bacterium]|jgi:hypothetical protein